MKQQLASIFAVPDSLVIDGLRDLDDRNTVIYCHTRDRQHKCPHCEGQTVGYDTTVNRKRHTVVGGKVVWLEVRKRRRQCRQCRKVFTEPVGGLSKKHSTDHLVQQIQEQARGSDYTSVAKAFGIGIATVSRRVDELPVADFRIPKKKT